MLFMSVCIQSNTFNLPEYFDINYYFLIFGLYSVYKTLKILENFQFSPCNVQHPVL
jgi:hypothetical protein